MNFSIIVLRSIAYLIFFTFAPMIEDYHLRIELVCLVIICMTKSNKDDQTEK